MALYEFLEKGLIPRSELFVVFHVCPLNVVLSELLSVFPLIFFPAEVFKVSHGTKAPHIGLHWISRTDDEKKVIRSHQLLPAVVKLGSKRWWIPIGERPKGPKLEPEGPKAEVGFPTGV